MKQDLLHMLLLSWVNNPLSAGYFVRNIIQKYSYPRRALGRRIGSVRVFSAGQPRAIGLKAL